MSKGVTHYAPLCYYRESDPELDDSVCGKIGDNSLITSKHECVTCKNCIRTKSFKR